jgi:hypothetical protein
MHVFMKIPVFKLAWGYINNANCGSVKLSVAGVNFVKISILCLKSRFCLKSYCLLRFYTKSRTCTKVYLSVSYNTAIIMISTGINMLK